jgi:L-ribulose-5-phosphate 4-epimerase
MHLKSIREQVLEANLELVRHGLVLYTFGNASGIDRDKGLVVIKPSGVPYDRLKPKNLVVVNLAGNIIEGNLRPSSDLPTHLVLYRAFTRIGGIAHTHSAAATAWAQARREIPCFGTTHADYIRGPVPVTRPLSAAQIGTDYEINTGRAIVARFSRLDPLHTPAVLVAGHGPFCWGKTPDDAAHVAAILEEIAAVAFQTIAANPRASAISRHLRDKHFSRKHGSSAYYGQQ